MKKLSLIVLVLAMVFTSACTQADEGKTNATGKTTLKIGYLPITHAGPLYMESHAPEEQLEGYDVELVKFGSWPDLMDALNTGRIDGASVLVQLAMMAKEQGIDLKAVALGHKDGNVLVTSKNIEETADLKGATYAIPHKFSSHNLLLNEMLKKDGLTYEDVNVVEMAPAEMPAALSEERIAGYVVAEPFGAQAVAMDKGKVHYHSDEIWPDSYCCVLVLRNDIIKKDEEIIQSFIDQYVKAGESANRKDDAVYESFSKYMKVDKEVLDLSLEWISYDDLRIEQEEYDRLAGFMTEMSLTENPPVYEEFVDNTFIDKAK
ncbi:ABC transporter substrate-binding protein [Sporosarcina cascadiensis]|uniref:ABC transporter substrate-binding protein n=1 Tax=Sporosarcina cascadiensis TaxID=2660747 RepID=UPI00129ADABA|nr:ABC transporter substrate-binding protein [Sporosarcina cascadiensis]